MMKIIGFAMSLNGIKTKCSLCGRSHRRSFLVEDEKGQKTHYGSGCIQKIGIDKRQLASTLSSVTVQTARLSYELMKNE